MSEIPVTSSPITAEESAAPVAASRARWPSRMLLASVVAILGGGLLLTANTSDVTKASEPGVKLVDGRPFLIDRVGDWTGGELQGLTEIERNLLPKDTEGARRLYADSNGDQLFCSIVLAGREVTSIHRPELCLPGQGWTIQEEHVQRIPLSAPDGGTLEVMQMNGTRSVPLNDGRTGEYRVLFIYWFIGKDRVTAHHWQRIFWTARDRVLHNTNHRWAYVMISVSMTGNTAENSKGRSEEEAMKVVAKFVRDIYPTLVEK
jgi:EpsI family protein